MDIVEVEFLLPVALGKAFRGFKAQQPLAPGNFLHADKEEQPGKAHRDQDRTDDLGDPAAIGPRAAQGGVEKEACPNQNEQCR